MTICEATSKRIEQLCRQKRLTGYSLTFQAGMPPSTFKSIMNGKSKNPGICNIKKIADGFGMTIREFFDSDIFNDLARTINSPWSFLFRFHFQVSLRLRSGLNIPSHP